MIDDLRSAVCQILCSNEISSASKVEKKLATVLGNYSKTKQRILDVIKSNRSSSQKLHDIQALLSTELSLEEYWENKYPRANIVYGGRSLPFSSQQINMPVNVLITPDDPSIIADLKTWGMYRTGENPETLVPKIYKKIKSVYYKYALDRLTWGKEEVWEFPFEMRAKGFGSGFDCDSWGVLQTSYYIAAGVPSWRVRCVAGKSSQGGHMTVYVFSLEDNEWHHLNSTYTMLRSRISSFPTHDDAKAGRDKIGIKEVWFSFTDKSAFADFKSSDSALDQKIRILKP